MWLYDAKRWFSMGPMVHQLHDAKCIVILIVHHVITQSRTTTGTSMNHIPIYRHRNWFEHTNGYGTVMYGVTVCSPHTTVPHHQRWAPFTITLWKSISSQFQRCSMIVYAVYHLSPIVQRRRTIGCCRRTIVRRRETIMRWCMHKFKMSALLQDHRTLMCDNKQCTCVVVRCFSDDCLVYDASRFVQIIKASLNRSRNVSICSAS